MNRYKVYAVNGQVFDVEADQAMESGTALCFTVNGVISSSFQLRNIICYVYMPPEIEPQVEAPNEVVEEN